MRNGAHHFYAYTRAAPGPARGECGVWPELDMWRARTVYERRPRGVYYYYLNRDWISCGASDCGGVLKAIITQMQYTSVRG